MKFDEKFIRGYTFDDVLVRPMHSKILPREVSLTTKLTRNISINVPFLSAAMDTVTESDMAIAVAREGGIGILHKNMSIEEQVAEVRKVKRTESAFISNPFTLLHTDTVGMARQLMEKEKINGVPIIDASGYLVGIVTKRDLKFRDDKDQKISSMMTTDIVFGTADTTMKMAEMKMKEKRVEKLPIVDASKKLIGLFTMRDVLSLKDFPNACKDSNGQLRVGAAVGVTRDTLLRVEALIEAHVDVIVLDTAHGHSDGVIEMVKSIKQRFTIEVIAGNIATGEAALALEEAGADAVKVGIGPGSICTTRIVTGVGVPQITAVWEVYEALQGRIPIISDGGVTQTGDVTKAIVAGADTIMMGSKFAGLDESPGEIIDFQGKKFKEYRGMGSVDAMADGSKDRYFQDAEDDIKKLVPEGIVGRIPYGGSLKEVMHQFIGGLRAAMGYTGSPKITDLRNAKFTLITSAGVKESHVHGVIMTKEAPNYSR